MKKELQAVGFDDKESEIYMALAKLGNADIAGLLKNTSIERRTIYDILERLVQKGLASYHEENNKRVYTPTDPTIIAEDLQQKEKDFRNIIPQLTNLNNAPETARVEIFRGINGLRTIFLDIVNSKEEHYSFGNITPFIEDERYTPIVSRFLKMLERNQVKEKIISAIGEDVKRIKGGIYRSLEKSMIPPTPTIIYGNVTVQYIFTEPVTIIKITSKEIADTNRKYFETYWKLSKK